MSERTKQIRLSNEHVDAIEQGRYAVAMRLAGFGRTPFVRADRPGRKNEFGRLFEILDIGACERCGTTKAINMTAGVFCIGCKAKVNSKVKAKAEKTSTDKPPAKKAKKGGDDK